MFFINKLLDNLKIFISRCTGQLQIPKDIKTSSSKKILHISDTPNSIYPFLFKLIDELKPNYIIHTGDLVDNVKLELGDSKDKYEEKLSFFLKELEKRSWANIYLVPGNHDSFNIIEKHIENIENIEMKKEGSIIEIEGTDISLAHWKENLSSQGTINLYGHNRKILTKQENIYLNGLLNINVILIPSLDIFKIPYPLKTKSGRKYRTLKLP